jgi:branched-chain amino acid transport system substrate-binding protein
MVQALQAAGQNPTRDSLVEAVEQAGGEWEGPGRAPFRYSADSHMGISGMSVVQITGDTTKELAPVQVTDIGDAEIEEFDGEAATPPENGIPDEEPVG